MQQIEVELLSHQIRALKSDKKFTLLRGGIGSGKSFTGSHFALSMLANSPNALGFIGANTFSQLQHSTLNCFISEIDRLGIPFKYNKNSSILSVYNSRILCKSMDNYEMHRGIEIGWFWLDESRDMKREAFEVMIGRLRDKKAKQHKALLTSSPKGFDWQYDYFEGEKATENCCVINARSHDNIYLPEGYIETLTQQYDEKMREQEIEGKIIDITSGMVYYSFKRDFHVKEFPYQNQKLVFGMDFNVDPMTSVCAFIENDTVYFWDEFYIRDGNTFKMSDSILSKYGASDIIPDSTSNKRSTNSYKSDIQILRESGHNVIFNPNPYVEDRYNCMNGLFSKNRIIIHPRCKNLIKDFERMSRNNKDPLISHISDAAGYLCWKHFPIKRIRPATSCIAL
ncbi:MAG: phage terminase large subunit [Candidatus Pacearchaeota archaeon]